MMKYFYYTLKNVERDGMYNGRSVIETDSETFPLFGVMQLESKRHNIPLEKVHITFWSEISKGTYDEIVKNIFNKQSRKPNEFKQE